ncbi:Rieske (2Fe-2S) protein [Streptomyces sp. YIM 98790]|uniref:Rieske (2Fe-2S) protein n=1 Tax=Streptomyces sp. YIM 98790 TaxID=2689077 RepID=UPI00140B0854|nr:Rieske (2Fe-2S) protein [Streptomyces sp. YIM 98790]
MTTEDREIRNGRRTAREARTEARTAVEPGRRRVLGGVLAAGGAAAGAVLLTSCYIPSEDPPPAGGSGGGTPQDPGGAGQDTGTDPADGSGGSDSGDSGGGQAAAPQGDPLVSSDEVPAGGGVVLAGQEIVVTRDDSGTVRAFSAICTHAGCLVGSVSNGTISCPCHGSTFDAGTGSPVSGPAGSPLSPVAVQETDGGVYPA